MNSRNVNIKIDFSIGDQQLYYLYKISITRNNENKITVVDGNCLPREYSYSFVNLKEQGTEDVVIKNFVCVGPTWPAAIKTAALKQCEECRDNCWFCNDSNYKNVPLGGQCSNCGKIKKISNE